VSIIKEQRKADLLAARYYKLAEGDRERAARDWYNQLQKMSDMISLQRAVERKMKKRKEKRSYL
jgi:flagellar basal body rod protein FlgF